MLRWVCPENVARAPLERAPSAPSLFSPPIRPASPTSKGLDAEAQAEPRNVRARSDPRSRDVSAHLSSEGSSQELFVDGFVREGRMPFGVRASQLGLDAGRSRLGVYHVHDGRERSLHRVAQRKRTRRDTGEDARSGVFLPYFPGRARATGARSAARARARGNAPWSPVAGPIRPAPIASSTGRSRSNVESRRRCMQHSLSTANKWREERANSCPDGSESESVEVWPKGPRGSERGQGSVLPYV